MSDAQLRADIGRLLWIGFEGVELDNRTRDTLKAGDAGGVTLFGRNLPVGEEGTDLDALAQLNESLHQAGDHSGEELLISVDQEGGRVQRVKAPLVHRAPMYSFASMSDEEAVVAAQELGEEMGGELCALGFDINFAPILDVNTNPDNPVIGDRAFSDNPAAVALRALAFARGLEAAGILACGKHFPGHGDTDTDSHLALPRLGHSMKRLQEVELLPFVLACQAKLPLLMTAHVVFACLDDTVPATLSHRVITGLLRDELGYEGVIVSDDMDMKAIADNFGVGDAAVSAVEAGCDVLLLCRNTDHQEQARSALHKAASSNGSLRERIAQSAARIRGLYS